MDASEIHAGDMKKVLLVDDDPVVLKTMKSFLDASYQVTAVKSGKVALKFLEKQSCDAIILDYMMPDMDGAQTFREIRSLPQGAAIPIIFATGLNDEASMTACRALNPQGYITKPANKEKLLESLAGLF